MREKKELAERERETMTMTMTMTMTHSYKVFTRGSTLPYGREWGGHDLVEKTLSNLQGPVRYTGDSISACNATDVHSQSLEKRI